MGRFICFSRKRYFNGKLKFLSGKSNSPRVYLKQINNNSSVIIEMTKRIRFYSIYCKIHIICDNH